MDIHKTSQNKNNDKIPWDKHKQSEIVGQVFTLINFDEIISLQHYRMYMMIWELDFPSHTTIFSHLINSRESSSLDFGIFSLDYILRVILFSALFFIPLLGLLIFFCSRKCDEMRIFFIMLDKEKMWWKSAVAKVWNFLIKKKFYPLFLLHTIICEVHTYSILE